VELGNLPYSFSNETSPKTAFTVLKVLLATCFFSELSQLNAKTEIIRKKVIILIAFGFYQTYGNQLID
jgi:hypothetical protein